MRIYLGDLGHNQLTISSDVYPLGIADLAAYLPAYFGRPEPLDIRLFREPQDLKTALDQAPPDVLGLSDYSWNSLLSLSFARYAKARDPKVLTLIGGPNFPLDAGDQEAYLRGMPEIDVAVRGPTYEGERAFLNLIQRYYDVGGSLEGLQEEAVPGNLWINRRTGELTRGADVPRIRDLDEIPSPYLAGLLDPFFSTGYFPLMQIARGCPFSCAFCNSSAATNSRVHNHSLENVRADLLYIVERVRSEHPLCLADDNFGMYALDEEVADFIAYLQDHYGWPHYIRTTTGKNQVERIIRVIRKMRGSLPMTAAVQSLSPEVLKNIKRTNISLDTYATIQQEVLRQGMQSYGELILCLPGETKASFMKSVSDLLDAGVKRVSAHQLMLLHGAPLSTPQCRALYRFDTRFRVVARNIGNYLGGPIVEVEEIVVATPDFSFQDYLDTRVFHLLLTIFYYEGNFEEAFEFARQEGIKPFELVCRLQARLNEAPAGFRELIADFLRESQEELFPSPEECIAWASEHFQGLVDGSIGGNLLSKYSMAGRFYLTQEAITFLDGAIAAALADRWSPAREQLLQAISGYLRAVLLDAPFSRSLTLAPVWLSSFDVEAWRNDKYAQPLGLYRRPAPVMHSARVHPDLKALIESRIATFGEHPSQLGKFTRTMFAQDLRRRLTPARNVPLEGSGTTA
jgi:radical SAM superfamily enzyme YgiQ (UPF0313 family)